ncbi:hypothetical protein C1J05_10010 [Sulfitobacter sp. JL08]|uniref:peptidoglycan-binding protein n=1 Tax=Sulfitobacter sp. JL08 TaxID=2070369 RepID=UPI000E0BF15B|nr:peptidoglycan-binding protein [Sulfitobacter sp. JL08]AXI54788.1 hypothetical protein C1J05_10010 [Sulfitobacter sp. JL08]
MSSRKFIVPTMLSAGLVPASSVVHADTGPISATKSLIDDIVHHAVSITELNEYDLSAHSSHQSHQSHGSHSSHRSYHRPEAPSDGITYAPSSENGDALQISGRNESSTPRSAVLPRSPSTARKPKILTGNTKKFGEIVSKVQIALLAEGYEVGTPNGELHSRTIAAVYKFQRNSGLVPSGKLEADTLNLLGIVAN